MATILSRGGGGGGELIAKPPGGRLNTKISSYQYMDPYVKDKTSYL